MQKRSITIALSLPTHQWQVAVTWLALATMLLLAACGDYEPHDKKTTYDPKTQSLNLPYPCPDWSHQPIINHDNSNHSNFGCATQTNFGLQLETPADLHRGHGTGGPDAEVTTRVIEQYRSGDLPVPLVPQQQDTAQ